MWIRISLLLLMFCFFFFPVYANVNWYEHTSMKITMETDEVLFEWEYENPNSFEFEKGDKIIRGEEAQKSFEKILSFFDLSQPKITGETIKLIEQEGFPTIRRLVIHRIDEEHQYQTWSWPVKD